MIKKILGTLIGILVFLITLYGLFYFFESKKITPQVKKEAVKETIYSKKVNGYKGDFPEFINFGLLSDSITNSKLTIGDKVIYDVDYDLDKYGLRRIPEAHAGKGRNHLILGGCSFTFGQGLQIGDTLPAKLEELLPAYNVHSVSFMGGAVQNVLHHLRIVSPKKYVLDSNGKFYYIYIVNHLNRFLNRPDYLSWVNKDYPYYEIENKKAVFKGFMKDQSFFQAYKKMEQSGLKNTALHLAATFKDPSRFDEKEIQLFVYAVKTLKDEYLKNFPKGEFTFVFHPNHGTPDEYKKWMMESMRKNKIKFIDASTPYKDHVMATRKEHDFYDYEIKGDGHPNALMNDYFSKYLSGEVLKKGDRIQK